MVMTTIAENDVLACNNASYVYVFDSCLNSLLDGHVMGNLEPGNVNVGSSGKWNLVPQWSLILPPKCHP